MSARLAGETALVTGGGRGIGRAIAAGLAAERHGATILRPNRKNVAWT